LPNKAVAASGSTALAGAICMIGFWAFGHPAPPEVQAAMTTVLSAGLTFAATYFTKSETP
jgi:hypothetical protein